jgi:hypothetical protein
VETEDLFREANDRISATARRFGLAEAAPYVCECSDRSCFATVIMTAEEYDALRADGARFMTLPGHAVDGGSVVEENERFAVVERPSV